MKLPWRIGAVGVGLLMSLGCSSDLTGPRVVAGVDLDALFADPSAAEVALVAADWDGRAPAATAVAVEFDTVFVVDGTDVRLRVVSHDVGGFLHYGAVLAAVDVAAPAPVLVYAHAGESGASVEEVLFQFPLLGADAARFVWVVPSFRGESLRFGGRSWLSTGPPSPWDRDVDDALALVEVAVDLESASDADNVAVLGFSRGAGVALLMAARDDRIVRVIDFFGPTDFFDDFVQDAMAEALRGSPADLPGGAWLDETVVQPLRAGQLTIAEARLELIRRSPVLFADRLPAVQIHHGDADDLVPVSQARALIAALEGAGRTSPALQAFIYAGGSHNPLTLSGSIGRAVSFLREMLPAPYALSVLPAAPVMHGRPPTGARVAPLRATVRQ